MNNNLQRRFSGSGKLAVGFIFLTAGVLLFLSKFGYFIPEWILSWPVLLIALGALFLIKSGGRRPQGFILLVVGLYFLPQQIDELSGFERFTGPLLFIMIGLFLLLKKNRFPIFKNRKDHFDRFDNEFNCRYEFKYEAAGNEDSQKVQTAENIKSNYFTPSADSTETVNENQSNHTDSTSREFLNDTAFLGNIKKNVVAKNFGGGEITAFFGGIELNFLNADIQGTAVLEATQFFGATKLVVPSNWLIITEICAILGGVEDKRELKQSVDTGKTLILKGACIFGGLQIMNF